ncbi:hypothetical protein L611_003100000330 [Aminobacter sp. J15]|nr:hypothetical protein L610_002800000180 [Aminobacter sp. J44]TWH30335.1 hypothetical protein L611_003100000330 [Aminobacter sp. J15]
MRSMVEGADGVRRVRFVLKGGLTELEAPRHGYIVPSKSMAHKDDLPALKPGPEPYPLYEPPPALRATSPALRGRIRVGAEGNGGLHRQKVSTPRVRWCISTSSCPCSPRASMPER